MQPYAHINIDVVWPTSLAGGERPGGTEFACGGTQKGWKMYARRVINILLTFQHVLPCSLSAEGCGSGGK